MTGAAACGAAACGSRDSTGAQPCAAPPAPESQPRTCAPTYLVPDWVRVRAEDFGLLFYDTRSTRLTFVRSGDALVPPPFTGERRVLRLRGDRDATPGPTVSRLLDDLVAKGLLAAAEAPGVEAM